MQSEIMKIIMDNIEYVVITVGAVVALLLFFPKVKYKKSNNDLTSLIIKYNKQKDAINKQTKSIF